jgi:hypothetical protein
MVIRITQQRQTGEASPSWNVNHAAHCSKISNRAGGRFGYSCLLGVVLCVIPGNCGHNCGAGDHDDKDDRNQNIVHGAGS